MNPLRRAATRVAVSASRVPSTKISVFGIATQFAAVPSARIIAPIAVRCFSQTLRVAEEEGEGAAAPETPAKAGDPNEPGHGLFIRNMVFEANEDHLREAYEKYGEITKVAVARDSRGLSRGYGFVWFTTREAMEQAVDGTNSSFWHGRRISVSPRSPRTRENKSSRSVGPTRSLYIGNIPYETTDAELNRIFRELNNVTDVRVAVDRTTGWPRGFAHADFTDVEAATAAMKHLQGITIGGRELRLDYAADVSKNPLAGQQQSS
ncbi:RNA-binding domain-containing protein [Cryphonectria parasitica EP155]|uniref:RNA-binding domain-containing protein n=1 Tax=Cryphonectria parasitica (strain ATCC 38755 / EP155) TaxID=660469 RepID=A0A9P5CSF0_CRYP1|nr:RNA-binding domain-containing protein [Cryphonectria parasitica EP155]KAF3769248.1 RNA-binding domain-containing protein [Cryphonectria parasitica EP155]